MDEKQLRREIALAITNLRGVKLVSFLCEYIHTRNCTYCMDG